MKRAVFLSLPLLVFTSVASAIELGRINVASSPGQNFMAEIPVTHFGQKIIKDDLTVIEGNSTGLGYKIEPTASGSKVVFLSDRPLNDLVVIDLYLSDGVEVLEKRIKLGSDSRTQAKSVAITTNQPSAFAKAAYREYKVRRGDSLSKIANSIEVPGMTNYQKQEWIFKNNIDSFRRANKNKLIPGRTLKLPVLVNKPTMNTGKAPSIGYEKSPDGVERQLKKLKSRVSSLSDKVDRINETNKALMKKLDDLTAMVKQGFAELKKVQAQ